MTLIDANVLLDVLTNDPRWAAWSIEKLRAAVQRGPLLINEIVYAEVSVEFETTEALDARLAEIGVVLAPTPKSALLLAGKAYREYRRAGGLRTGVLPDFFIDAHTAAAGLTLLSRDRGAIDPTSWPST